MSNKVEDYFITPLEAHFENIPTDGSRETLLHDMDAHSEELLNEVVEWLKRNRQSQKTFPSPKECNRALKAVIDAKVVVPARMSINTNGMSYGEKLKAWVKMGGKGWIIHQSSLEWTEWFEYFKRNDCWVQLEFMASRESWTVPTQLPVEFDARMS